MIKSGMELQAKKFDNLLIDRARETHEAPQVVGSHLWAKSVRFAAEANTIEIATEGWMRPIRPCSPRANAHLHRKRPFGVCERRRGGVCQ